MYTLHTTIIGSNIHLFFFLNDLDQCVCLFFVFFINYQIANEINDFKNALQL